MHIVIADDLTGAAELAGVGLSRGLRAVVSTTAEADRGSDLWCLATDTRSYIGEDVGDLIGNYTSVLKRYEPKLFYKKIDSVLRGKVMQECDAFTKAQGLDRAVIIPANPSLNRIVRDGTYFIGDIPLAEANLFRSKKSSSRLLDLINPAYRNRTRVIKEVSELDGPGFYIGEVETYADLLKWAALAGEPVALCGASDFFDALLEYRSYAVQSVKPPEVPFGKRQLFVLGSATADNDLAVSRLFDQGFIVSNMPWSIFDNAAYTAADIGQWAGEIEGMYRNVDKLVITMNYREVPLLERPHLKVAVGQLIHMLIGQAGIDELFVEGGATSYAVLQAMQADRLIPVQDLARGVTRMEIVKYPPLKMTVKPGSYQWPEAIWPRLKNAILD